jgi:uncharacterized membrane protein
MNSSPKSIAKELFRAEWEQLSSVEKQVIENALHRIIIPRNPNKEFYDRRTIGERASDLIAKFGGSWTFILLFGAWLAFWAVLNTEILGPLNKAFDPYPYIFLNLVLSMIAAIQAPILMMSQNREAARDRLEAEIDHEVNVRAEIAIRQLDERLSSIESILRSSLLEKGIEPSKDTKAK